MDEKIMAALQALVEALKEHDNGELKVYFRAGGFVIKSINLSFEVGESIETTFKKAGIALPPMSKMVLNGIPTSQELLLRDKDKGGELTVSPNIALFESMFENSVKSLYFNMPRATVAGKPKTTEEPTTNDQEARRLKNKSRYLLCSIDEFVAKMRSIFVAHRDRWFSNSEIAAMVNHLFRPETSRSKRSTVVSNNMHKKLYNVLDRQGTFGNMSYRIKAEVTK